MWQSGRTTICLAMTLLGGWLMTVAGPAAVCGANQPERRTIDGQRYMSVVSVAKRHGLGSNKSSSRRHAEYRTGTMSLSVSAERRDIQINGVYHWLDRPIRDGFGALWVAELDVRKTIEPVFSPQLSSARAPVRTIVLDPGHGGTDRGATGGSGRTERWFTLDLAKKVEQELAGQKIKIVLTRRDDRTVSLADRVALAKKNKADLFVSLHFNSGGSAHGIETFCLTPAGASSTSSPQQRHKTTEPGNEYDAPNVWLAHCVQHGLLSTVKANDRGVRRARFLVLRDAPCPAVLIEAGFLSNPVEERKILDAVYRDELAKGIAAGIRRYVTVMK